MTFDVDGARAAHRRDRLHRHRGFPRRPTISPRCAACSAFYLGSHRGRNDFEGERTERVYTLVARGRVFWRIALDPRILALCERFLLPNFLLTASQAIQIYPGESAAGVPQRRRLLPPAAPAPDGVAVDHRGGRRLHGGERRHRGHSRQPSLERCRAGGQLRCRGRSRRPTSRAARRRAPCARAAVTMPAGGCVVFAGTLLHRGGANRSDRSRCAFSQSILSAVGAPAGELHPRRPGRGRARDADRDCRSCSATRSTRRSSASSPPAIRSRRWRPDYTNRVDDAGARGGARLPE